MKNSIKLSIDCLNYLFRPRRLITTLLTVLLACIWAPSGQAQAFNHPGVRHSQADLDLMKSRILANQQPWKGAYDNMIAWPGFRDGKLGRTPSSLNFPPAPRSVIDVGFYENPHTGQDEAETDATAAYIHAIQWYITGNAAHANKVIEICNAWGNTLTSIQGDNAILAASWAGGFFCEAAEIVKTTYTGAAPGAWTSFDNMLRTKFYPVLQNFTPPSYNGNWGALCTQTMMSMGVVLNDRVMYDRGKNYFLNNSGDFGTLKGYVRTDGTTQETTRDQYHEQMGVLAMSSVCEIAWKQGEDLYSTSSNLLLKGLEGTAGRVDSQNIPCYSGWDLAYNHYKTRKGLSTPKMDALRATAEWKGGIWSYNTIGLWTAMTFRDLGDPSGTTVGAPSFSPAGGTYSSTQSVTLSSSTSGASIRYTTDGSTPSSTVGTVYSGPLTVSGNATIKGIAYKTGLTTSAVTSATYTFVAPGTVIVSAGGVFTNTAMTSQTGTFTATFQATPSADPTNALVGLSNGSQSAFSGFACAARFNPTGNIDARNGGAYAAASTIAYAPNTTYAFRVVANVPARTYSVYVTPAGGSEVTVGSNYAFRTEQASVASLNNWGAVVDTAANGGVGSMTVASFAIGGAVPSAPVFTPAAGTYTSVQSVTISSSGSTSIRYTTDGSTPSATVGTVYSGPVAIGATGTLKAVGINATGASPVTTGAYTINIPSTATLTATADTYAFGGSTATNYGTATVLGAKDDGTTSVSFDRIAYVKFDLSGLAFTPTTATLILATDATTQAGTVTVNQCTTDSWTETGLTWANKPATGATIGTATVAAGVVADKSINVGSYVNSQYTGDATKIVSFALTGNNAQLYFKSREAGAGNAPELVVGN